MLQRLGRFFSGLRDRSAAFKWLFFLVLVLLVVLNFFIHPHHPHVSLEKYAGFWAAFALVFAGLMAFVIKRIIANLVKVPEDFYDPDA
ncbi:hypothetical protein [Desulfohalovibrio reitneri]|uniref:hypothetical protein n=1 Tax=Desulfohalovibrio reitneri TaxID=1307759 RepID=UPI0004A6E6D5|nr:hypothetical protein [Desulfohalovibrio reitneri]